MHTIAIFAHNMCMNAQINDWNQVRTAYHVARLGTVSAAARFLGVHHATVIRLGAMGPRTIKHSIQMVAHLFHLQACNAIQASTAIDSDPIAKHGNASLKAPIGLFALLLFKFDEPGII